MKIEFQEIADILRSLTPQGERKHRLGNTIKVKVIGQEVPISRFEEVFLVG